MNILRPSLILVLLASPFWMSRAQSYDEYLETWRGEKRARFITYRYDLTNRSIEQSGYVSDRPLEWSRNLGGEGENELVDPFDFTVDDVPAAKHVLIMVHGYGPGAILGGAFADRDEEFSTEFVSHHSGATLWYDDPTGPSLYSYLRESSPTDGFDQREWVILGVTLDIRQGAGLSILENQRRLRALMDLLWHHKEGQIRTISFASHSTGSPIVKGVLGSSDPDEHPWIDHVDDHLNLAGALGGTQMVLFDAPAAVGAPDLRHQLMYGIQDPADYEGGYQYFAGRTASDATFKRTYRWPSHVNVLSVAGVWPDAPNGDPWSGDGVDIIPWNISNPTDLRFVSIYTSKSDGVVPSTAVLEHVQYKEIDLSPLGSAPFAWNHQIAPEDRYGVDHSGSWVLPNLGSPGTPLTTGGAGMLPLGATSPADAIPAADRFPGEKVTYVEIAAQHNGMLHNEHLLRALRRRLGTRTVAPNVEQPRVTGLSEHQGLLAGGNTIQIYGSGFNQVSRILFGEVAVSEPRIAGSPPDWTIDSPTQITVEVPEGIPTLADDPTPNVVDVTVMNAAGASEDNGAVNDYQYVVQARAPVIDPPGGVFDTPTQVTLSTESAGAAIYYTLNGSEPRPGISGTHAYAQPFTIAAPLTGDFAPFTLRAKAVGPNYADSPISTAEFTIEARVDSPTIFPDGGDFTGFVNVTLGTTTPGATIYYTTDGSEPTYNSTPYTGQFRLEVGTHTVKARAYRITYNASAVSTAEFRVYDPSAARAADPILYPLGSGNFTDAIDVSMINHTEGAEIRYTIGENAAPANPTESSTLYTEPFELGYNEADVEQGGTTWFIRATAFKAGLPPSNLVQRAYTVAPGIAATVAPVFTPAGGTFENDVTVSIASSTAFARLYYTTDGSEPVYDPDLQSHATPATINLNRSTTVRAIAKRPFFSTSTETAAEFIFKNATPQIATAPAGNVIEIDGADVYIDSVEVSLSTATDGAVLRYTLDGSEPGEDATLYEGPFYVDRPATVTARAFKSGYVHSDLAERSLVVQSGNAPVITRHPDDRLVEAGSTVIFAAAAVGTPSPAFQWQRNGADIAGATSDTLRLANVQLTDAAGYRAIVSNSAGADTSDAATLQVEAAFVAPLVITEPDTHYVATGGVHTFSVVATGKPSPSYRWYKEDALLEESNAGEFTIRNIELTHEGDYSVVVTNQAGVDSSALGYLSVIESVAPTITRDPTDVSVAEGDTARFSVLADGVPAPTYRWLRESTSIPGAVESLLTIPNVQPTDAGSYAVIVFNVAGLDTSRAAILSVAGGTASETLDGLPIEFALHGNYPNPFNPATTLAFDLPRAAEVEFYIYDVVGRRVMQLREGSLAAGRYRKTVDFSELASGLYFYEIRALGSEGIAFRDVNSFILVK